MNNEEQEVKRYVVDFTKMPEQYPTHRHPPKFWECLGRAVATFGYLEEVLGKAIFAFTATRRYSTEEEAYFAYIKWLPTLERALYDQLYKLAESYGKAVHGNVESTISNVDELVCKIKAASKLRNAFCHGSWRTPDMAGKSLPLYVTKKLEVFETPIDITILNEVQRHVAELSCAVVSSVTHMGWQFPGGVGPGKEIWPDS